MRECPLVHGQKAVPKHRSFGAVMKAATMVLNLNKI